MVPTDHIRRHRAILSLLAVGFLLLAAGVRSARAGEPSESIAQSESHIALVGQAGGAASAVANYGHYAVLGVGAQVAIADVTDPEAAREVYRSAVLRDVVADVAVAGDLAYVVHGQQLLILDISRPEDPRALSHEWFHFLDDIRGIVVHDGYAYLLLESLSPWGIGVIDVRDPEAPEQVTSSSSPDYGSGPFGWPQDIAAQGNHVYSAGSAGLVVVDVTDPAEPARVGEADIEPQVYGVAVADRYAYLATDRGGTGSDGGLLIYDVSDPTQPALVGSNAEPCRHVAVDGSHAYVALSPAGLGIVDVSDPSRPVTVRTEPFGSVADIAAAAGQALVAEPERGVTALHGDTQPPSDRSIVLETWSAVVDVVSDGSLAYAGYGDGIAIVDLATPADPQTLSTLDVPERVARLAVDGDRVYAATAADTVVVVGVGDPAAPVRLGSVATDGPVEEIAAADGLLVLAEAERLRVVDMADPVQPRDVGSIAFEYWAPSGLLFADGFAYLADGAFGLRVFAVSDSAPPSEVAGLQLDTPLYGATRGIAVSGTRLYMPHGPEVIATPPSADALYCPPPPPPEKSRIVEIDITDPRAPELAIDKPQSGWPRGLAVADDFLFVASGVARFYQTALIVSGIGGNSGYWNEAPLPTVPQAVAAIGDHVVVAGREAGLLVAELREGAAPTLTPRATREASPSPTIDPNATSTATPSFHTPTPLPTETALPTPTADRPSGGPIFVPIASRGRVNALD